MAQRRSLFLRSPLLLDSLMRHAFTNRSLAHRAGCSHQMIGHLRTGDKRACRQDLAHRIACALNVGVEDLFTDHDAAPGPEPTPLR